MIIDEFPGVRALVIGDSIRDSYYFGQTPRIAPEAPVPVFVGTHWEEREGGALNVVAQLQELGCQVLNQCSTRPSVKKRYLVGHQLLMRIDEDMYETPTPAAIESILDAIVGKDVIVLSDYAKGWLVPSFCQRVIEVAKKHAIPVIVDPKGDDWTKYEGATLICPNEDEYNTARMSGDPAHQKALLVKRGPAGMTLTWREGKSRTWSQTSLPAEARHVYDVTGAGDTVVATVAAAIGAGASQLEAAQLAILTSGWVVGEVGTAVCPVEVLREMAC